MFFFSKVSNKYRKMNACAGVSAGVSVSEPSAASLFDEVAVRRALVCAANSPKATLFYIHSYIYTYMTHNYNFENNSKKLLSLNNILPFPETQWIYTNNCYHCKSAFGFIQNKQHHCRACGRCVCSNCCDTIDIPYAIVQCPPENNTYKGAAKNIQELVYNKRKKIKSIKDILEERKKTVCRDCFTRLSNLKTIEISICILEFCDLKTIHIMSTVSKKYNYAYTYIMHKFLKIQTKDIRKCTTWEINMIKQSNIYFKGHNLWNKQYIKYILTSSYGGQSFDNIFDNQIGKVKCSNLLCLCGCEINGFTIFDLMEIISFILHLENNSNNKMFWKNENIKKILFDIIKRVNIENNEMILTSIPLWIKLLSILLMSVDEAQYKIEKNKELITELFDLLCRNSKLLSNMACEITKFFDNNIGEYTNFAFIFKEYINSKNFDRTEIKAIRKQDKFFFDKIYTPTTYVWDDQKTIIDINKSLPVRYPFDDNYMITKFHNFIDLNGYSTIIKYGLFGNRGILVEISFGEIKKDVTLIIKGNEMYEYFNYIIIKMLLQKYNYDLPINDVYSFRKDLYLVRVENNITLLSSIYSKKLDIKDHIYETGGKFQLDQIIKNYSQSLSLLYCTAKIFVINIKNRDQIVMNNVGQIYFSRFSKDEKKENYDHKVLHLTDIIGSKNSVTYKNFSKETALLYKKLRPIKSVLQMIYSVLIKNLLQDPFDIDINENIDVGSIDFL
jgi:hypothetical protein